MHMDSTTKGNIWLDMVWFSAVAVVLIVAAAEYFW
jgi:hypothetical protein